jgi:hypothetical protein
MIQEGHHVVIREHHLGGRVEPYDAAEQTAHRAS